VREMATNYTALFILANRCVFSFFLKITTDSVFLISSSKLFHTTSDKWVKDLDASTDVSHFGLARSRCPSDRSWRDGLYSFIKPCRYWGWSHSFVTICYYKQPLISKVLIQIKYIHLKAYPKTIVLQLRVPRVISMHAYRIMMSICHLKYFVTSMSLNMLMV